MQTLRRGAGSRPLARLVLETLESRLAPAAHSAWVPDELLVAFQPASTNLQRQAVRLQLGAVSSEALGSGVLGAGAPLVECLKLPAGLTVEQAIARLKAHPQVAVVEPNYQVIPSTVANDPLYANGSQWGLYGADLAGATGPTGTTNPYGSNAEVAWAAGATGSARVYVGIIDQGIQASHPDLAANVWVNPYDPADGIDNDGNGFIDDVHGWDFLNNDNTVDDGGEWHGTPVAGIAGAVGGNGVGVSGVAQQVGLISTKFMGSYGSISGVIRSLDYLTDLKLRHGVNVVAANISWNSGSYYSQLLHESILRAARADILFVAAAGNNGFDTDVTLSYPANYTTLTGTLNETAAPFEAVLTVAALDSAGGLAGFSNRGAQTVDLAAPGVDIVSTTPGSGYGGGSGTSFATPFVTGAVAVYAAAHPQASAAQTRAALLAAAQPTPSLAGVTVTGARLDLGAAVGLDPSLLLRVSDAEVFEGDTGSTELLFRVTLSGPSSEPVTVDYATRERVATPGVEYLATAGTLTFAPGQTEQVVRVTVLGDTVEEWGENLGLSLSNPAGALVSVGDAVGRIIDDEVSRVSINNLEVLEGNRGKTARSLTISLSKPCPGAVEVAWHTLDGSSWAGSDYASASGTVRFRPGQTAATISVSTLGDTLPEMDECLHVALTIVSGQVHMLDGFGTIRLLNDDLLGGDTGSGGSGGPKKITTRLASLATVQTSLALEADAGATVVETDGGTPSTPRARARDGASQAEVLKPASSPTALGASPQPTQRLTDRLFSFDLKLDVLSAV